MKKRVMFVGGAPSEIYDVVRFRAFGQVEDLDVDLAHDAARGGANVLPVDDPAAEAFTADELVKFASFGAHEKAPPEFKAKLLAARVAAAAFRDEAEQAFESSLKEAIHG